MQGLVLFGGIATTGYVAGRVGVVHTLVCSVLSSTCVHTRPGVAKKLTHFGLSTLTRSYSCTRRGGGARKWSFLSRRIVCTLTT